MPVWGWVIIAVIGVLVLMALLRGMGRSDGGRRVELPVVVNPPVVSSKNLDSLGIKELVSEATTYFKGSTESRMQNIALAASKFNGVVVPPGGPRWKSASIVSGASSAR